MLSSERKTKQAEPKVQMTQPTPMLTNIAPEPSPICPHPSPRCPRWEVTSPIPFSGLSLSWWCWWLSGRTALLRCCRLSCFHRSCAFLMTLLFKSWFSAALSGWYLCVCSSVMVLFEPQFVFLVGFSLFPSHYYV